jgi:hypothetical protein
MVESAAGRFSERRTRVNPRNDAAQEESPTRGVETPE